MIDNEWTKIDAGRSKSIDYNEFFTLYRRIKPLNALFGVSRREEIIKSSYDCKTFPKVPIKQKCAHYELNNAEKPMIRGKCCSLIKNLQVPKLTGSFPAQKVLKDKMTPEINNTCKSYMKTDYKSLKMLQNGNESLCIAYNCTYATDSHDALSWEFSLINNDNLYEYVFVKNKAISCKSMWLELCTARILDDLNANRIKRCNAYIYNYLCSDGKKICEKAAQTKEEASRLAEYAYINGKRSEKRITELETSNNRGIKWTGVLPVINKDVVRYAPVTLICCDGVEHLSSFDQSGVYRKDFLPYLTQVGGGVFSGRPICLEIPSVDPRSGWEYIYTINLSIRDVICSAPEDQNSIADLEKTVGLKPAVSAADQDQNDMNSFLDVVSHESVAILLYMSKIYGVNRSQPATILAGGAEAFKNSIIDHFGYGVKNFDSEYRGLMRVSHGLKKRNDGFAESSSLEPINDDANTLQTIAALSYHGGYNGCSEIGYYDHLTYDYDLKNAYPTAMCLVPDVDWSDCIVERITDHLLTIEDFVDSDGNVEVFPLLFAYVKFEFPATVMYPCISMNSDGVPFCPRTSVGADGVYACGPELYLAARLGAKVTIKTGYRARVRKNTDGSDRYSLRSAVKQYVVDRDKAKAEKGKWSIEEQILKLLVNGTYGKIAQNVIPKKHWSVIDDKSVNTECSCITNPVSAAMITSIVRAVLLATQNEAHTRGYRIFSTTTDGFISDVPFDELKGFDLFGIGDAIKRARLYLSGNEEFWEIKHMQNDLLNFTTRGNVSLNTGTAGTNPVFELSGVCAHNGVKSGFESDSYDDRCWLYYNVLSRTGKVEYIRKDRTSLRDLCGGDMYRVSEKVVHQSMDFDLKRKPDPLTFVAKQIKYEDKDHEIMNFTTLPFENIAEFELYRRKGKDAKCLRTHEEWNLFMYRLADKSFGNAKPRDLEWSKIASCVIGVRMGIIDVPYLSSDDISV